jgi:hypothetical protein
MDRHKVLPTMEDFGRAKQDLGHALAHESSPVAQRLAASRRLLSIVNVHDEYKEAFRVAKNTIELVHLLFLPSLSNYDREYSLSEMEGLASDGAAIALTNGQDCFQAVNLLELGRGLLHGSLYDLRSDLDELWSGYPELAESLVTLRLKLGNSQRQDSMVADGTVLYLGMGQTIDMKLAVKWRISSSRFGNCHILIDS